MQYARRVLSSLALLVVTIFAAQAQEIQDEVMRAFAERLYTALEKRDIKVGLVEGSEHVQLRWSSGWQPPAGTVITKVDVDFRLWENGEAATRDYDALVGRTLGADWQSKVGSVGSELSYGDIRGVIGGSAGDLIVYDEAEKRWRPQALLHGALICGDLTISLSALTRGQFQVQSTDLAVPGPDGSFKPEFIREAEALMRQPQEAIRMIAEKLSHAFDNRDLCKARPKEEDILARFVPVMETLGMAPERREPNMDRLTDPVGEHLFWENKDGLSRFQEPGEWQKVTGQNYDSPDTAWGGFDSEVGSAKAGFQNFAEFMEGRSFEDASEILDIKPMLGMTVAVAYGPVNLVGWRGEAGVLAYLVCGTVKFNVTGFNAQPFQPDDTPREAMLAWSRDASNALYAQIHERILALKAEIEKQKIECPVPVDFEVAETEAEGRLFDANPMFNGNRHVAELSDAELARMSQQRNGAVADGVSRLVVVIEAEHKASVVFTMPGATENSAPDGRVLPLKWEGQGAPPAEVATNTVEVDGRHYAIALYEPPESFGTGTEGALTRTVSIEASLTAQGDQPVSPSMSIEVMLARPPVVLVHGTYSTPEKWNESMQGLGGRTMVDTLKAAGFETFVVDYTATNGSSDENISRFEDNRNVVGRGRGSIEAALEHFRDRLNLAATQADVVGHSLGGLLARVWASPAFRAPDEPYLRPENFDRGDIHRLITLCTPHYGSDLPRIIVRMQDVKVGDVRFPEWAVNKSLSGIYAYFAGLKSGAARNQIPESEELKRIGATDVRAHAIGCIVALDDLYDQKIIDANKEYVDLYTHLARSLAEMPGVMAAAFAGDEATERASFDATLSCNRAAPVTVGWVRQPTSIAERLQAVVGLMDWAKWDADKRAKIELLCSAPFCSTPERSLLAHAMELGLRETVGQSLTERVLVQYFRLAIFGNQPNDGTVRLQSQLAGLGEKHSTILTHVLHGVAPLTAKAQKRVVELLTGPQDPFAASLPPAGAPTEDRPLGLLAQNLADRLWAINRSNIVPEQAEAIARVARACNAIIMVRPVNEHSTPLIATGAATKNMHVKGKSADWGPQKGYIAVDQAYSKLANEPKDREDNIKVFNCEVVASLTPEPYARRRALSVTFQGQTFEVRKPRNAAAGIYPPPLYLKRGDSDYLVWGTMAPATPDITDDATVPLEVLTAPDRDLYLTADYDLLAIGTPFEDRPTASDLDKDRGYITPFQKELVAQINAAVAGTGHTGGDVVHHGPENQFPFSPGNDYPVTAFIPDAQDTWIQTIEKGPDGRKDALLKRFFSLHKVNRWSLLANDVWRWGDWDNVSGRYREEDAPKAAENKGQKPKCDALPPCGAQAPASVSWNLPAGVDPSTVGCWP